MSTKVAFVDFWDGFDPKKNFFVGLFSSVADIEVTSPSECDVLVFSCFGHQNKLYRDPKRIFYTGENIRPSYDRDLVDARGFNVGRCDYSFSFDFSDDPRNVRIPLWMLQIDWFNVGGFGYGNPQFVMAYDQLHDNLLMRKERTKFSSFVFNSTAPHRYEMVAELSKYKPVDCFGKPHRNWFYGEDQKLSIISDYKFNICFENTISPGYYTEKPIHAKFAGCVPVYWSDAEMGRDFNAKAFLNLSDFSGVKELCDKIIALDQDDASYEALRNEPMFSADQDPKKMFDAITEQIRAII